MKKRTIPTPEAELNKLELVNKSTYIFFLLILNLSSVHAFVQDSLKVQMDTSKIKTRSFSNDLAQKYQDEAFNYESSVEGEAQNFLARALYVFMRKMGEWFGIDIDPGTYQIVEIIMYGLLILIALYIIIKLLTGQSATAFFGKKNNTLAPLNIQEEHIESVDLDQFIRDALAQKNYRLAIRFMYLKSLKELSSLNLIQWHFEKTNQDYYRELQESDLKESFKKVSYLYDYVWYGAFEIDSHGFTNAQRDFERFSKHMRNAR